MSGREDRANRELHALQSAYQRGQLDRAGYRARRRGVLAALRVRDEITARNALVPGGGRRHDGAVAATRGRREDGASLLFSPRWMPLPRWTLVVALLGIGALAAALVWIATGDGHVR